MHLLTNLYQIITNIQASGAKVVLMGIHSDITELNLSSKYSKLVGDTHIYYAPNVLENILGHSMYLSDTVHPNNTGYALIADQVVPTLE